MVDRDLLLDFFLTFSRFEYALKATRYCGSRPRRRHGLPAAEPNWDRFARDLRGRFDPANSCDLREACRYLTETPPYRQVVIDGRPAWETPGRDAALSEVEFLLLMVRSVRNNLFHGGKHNAGLHQTRARTERLLRSSLIVLRACLPLTQEVADAFASARL